MKLRWFGPNMGYPPFDDYDPADVGAAGFNCVVLNLTDHPSLPSYVQHCHARGMLVVGRIVSGSLDRFESPVKAARYYRSIGIDMLTVGNEIDGKPAVNTDGSWFQSKADWEAMRTAFVQTFAGSGIPLYGPGTVTGQPDRLEPYSLIGLQGLDDHLYTAEADTIWDMLGGYDGFDGLYGFKERSSSEWGWPGRDPQQRGQYVVRIIRAIEDGNDRRAAQGQSIVTAMLPYCWDRAQHPQPFFLNHPDAIAEIRQLGYGPGAIVTPAPQPAPAASFVLGFAKWAALEPDLIGEPLRNERNVWPQWQTQPTSNGVLSWVGGKGHAFVTRDGRVFHWSEDWQHSEEVAA